MKKTLVLLLALFLVCAAGFLYDMYLASPSGTAVEESEVNKADMSSMPVAPDFAFTDIHHRKHHLSDYKGKVVLLNFWASWCIPCVKEFPDLLALVEKHKGRVVLLALSSDDSEKAIHDFLKKLPKSSAHVLNSADVIVALDKNRAIAHDLFLTVKYPETTILTPSQRMAKKIAGVTDWNGTEMHDFLQSIQK